MQPGNELNDEMGDILKQFERANLEMDNQIKA
jgi:hypothetical protein